MRKMVVNKTSFKEGTCDAKSSLRFLCFGSVVRKGLKIMLKVPNMGLSC